MKRILFALTLLAATTAHAAITPTVMVGIHANADGLCDSSIATNAAYCEADIQARESEIGRTFAIDSQYGPFDFSSIPEAEWTVTQGRMPMYTWQHVIGTNGCIFWQDVVNGVYDSQLTTQATYLATLGPMIVRLLPEMNKSHQSCIYDVDPVADPVTAGSEFQQLWQHVYSVVHPIATNVQWDFSPGADAFNDAQGNPVNIWTDFYPGDAYVDWIGSQIYNDGTTSKNIDTYPKFLNFYSQAVLRGKPLILSETGAIEIAVTPDPQQKWCYSISQTFRYSFPAVKALVWFDVNATGGDYLLGGNGEVGFANMAAKPYFSKMP